MPLVRINVKEANSKQRRRIGECVHEALVEVFSVPADDRFQIITEHGRNLVYVIVQVTSTRDGSEEKKAAFYRRTVELLHAQAGVRPENVFISLVEVPKENWSFGNGIAQYAQLEKSGTVEHRPQSICKARSGQRFRPTTLIARHGKWAWTYWARWRLPAFLWSACAW